MVDRPVPSGHDLHDLRDVPLRQRDPLDAALRHRLRGRRLPVAALLAADPAGLAAVLDQPGPPDPVDPARLPGDLLLLPEGVLPLLLRRSARLRCRRAGRPSALRDGDGTAVHPPERAPVLPVPRIRPALLPVGRRGAIAPIRGPVADRPGRLRPVLQRGSPLGLLLVMPFAATPHRRPHGLLLVHASGAGPSRDVATA